MTEDYLDHVTLVTSRDLGANILNTPDSPAGLWNVSRPRQASRYAAMRALGVQAEGMHTTPERLSADNRNLCLLEVTKLT